MGLQEPKWHLAGEPEIDVVSFDKDTQIIKYKGLELTIPGAICLANAIEKIILQNVKWEPKESKWIVGSCDAK